MLTSTFQTTLAFAPSSEDIDDIDFFPPVIAFSPPFQDEEESEPGEP